MKSPIVTRDIDPLSIFPYMAFPRDFKNSGRFIGETPCDVLKSLLAVMTARNLYVEGQWECTSCGKDPERSVAGLFDSVSFKLWKGDHEADQTAY
jgi:hypothetical protein